MSKMIATLLLVLLLVGAAPAGVTTQSLLTLSANQTGGNPNVRVWVNTNAGVYHCPGTRWYGKTKEGEYMAQKLAQSKGYRPAYGNVCH